MIEIDIKDNGYLVTHTIISPHYGIRKTQTVFEKKPENVLGDVCRMLEYIGKIIEPKSTWRVENTIDLGEG